MFWLHHPLQPTLVKSASLGWCYVLITKWWIVVSECHGHFRRRIVLCWWKRHIAIVAILSSIIIQQQTGYRQKYTYAISWASLRKERGNASGIKGDAPVLEGKRLWNGDMFGCYGDMLKLAQQQLIITPTDWYTPVWRYWDTCSNTLDESHLLVFLDFRQEKARVLGMAQKMWKFRDRSMHTAVAIVESLHFHRVKVESCIYQTEEVDAFLFCSKDWKQNLMPCAAVEMPLRQFVA